MKTSVFIYVTTEQFVHFINMIIYLYYYLQILVDILTEIKIKF